MTPLVVKGLDRPERTTLPHDVKFVLLGFRDIEGWPRTMTPGPKRPATVSLSIFNRLRNSARELP